MGLEGTSVAVTGAGGFIGSALVPALLEAGADVRALIGPAGETLSTPPAPALGMRGEITDKTVVRRLCDGADIVVHLAGPPSVAASFVRPREFARVHVLGTLEVLEACRAAPVRRLLYLSSAEVYGRPQYNPVGEDQPLSALSPYGACKIAAEQFAVAHAAAYSLPVTILRAFSVYGPGLSPLSLIGTLLRQARGVGSLSVQDLGPIRDYCHLRDVVHAIVLACQHAPAGVLTLNIGSGHGTSVKDVVATFLRVLNRDLPVIEQSTDSRPGQSEIRELVADISRARSVLGWSPIIDLSEGLRQLTSSSGTGNDERRERSYLGGDRPD
jgi:nucleoside-diphosphate-sugar epimerase